jgi:REP element-mobilizing transposase RayT
MPDHVHLLLEGLYPTTDLLGFVKAVKTKSSTPFTRKTARPLWQKKFYDHILRRNDSPDDVAWYIWKNPVRAGLCRRPGNIRSSAPSRACGRKRLNPRSPGSLVEEELHIAL